MPCFQSVSSLLGVKKSARNEKAVKHGSQIGVLRERLNGILEVMFIFRHQPFAVEDEVLC